VISTKEKILFSFLGCIFAAQIFFLGVGINYCIKNGGLTACPEIGKRVEITFGTMTATVLALLTGVSMTKQ
tara:strand:- start:120 stop:332 length:213 start_codon:yes stop_codon:yes gene_type:complete